MIYIMKMYFYMNLSRINILNNFSTEKLEQSDKNKYLALRAKYLNISTTLNKNKYLNLRKDILTYSMDQKKNIL